MACVEADVEHNMQMVLDDWGMYQAAKSKRPDHTNYDRGWREGAQGNRPKGYEFPGRRTLFVP